MKFATRLSLFAIFAFAAPAARADDAANKVAEELLIAMKADKVMAQGIDQMLDLQVKQNPSIAKLRPVMKSFFDKYMSWDAMKGDMAALYASEFTTAELQEMVKFYNSPIGRKMAAKTPILTTKSMALGMKRVQDHQAELTEMIQAELKK